MTSRRALLRSFMLAAVARSSADAQQLASVPRIVLLSLASPVDHVGAFEEGLRTLGYTPGTTIAISHRSAEAREAALPALAREAVALEPQVIVAIGTPAAIAARQATKTLPIVAVAGDIVAAGLVANLGRPEGNVTGLSFFALDLMLKRFDLLMELVPQIRRVTTIVEAPPHPTQAKGVVALRTAAKQRGVEVREVPLARVEDVTAVLAKLRNSRIDGVLLWSSTPDRVRARYPGDLAPRRHLRRSHSSGSQTWRPSGRATDQV